MKILKKLFVGSIILLMLTTPLLVTAGVNEKTNVSSLNVYDGNSLGKITVAHIPLYIGWFKNHGVRVRYEGPPDNPGYDYYFTEVAGEVYMNFSLTVEHRLDDINMFFADRYTWINNLWISGGSPRRDYFSIENKTLCDNISFETYYINITEEEQLEPLKTNGESVYLEFWLFGMPAATNSPGIHILMELLPGLPLNFLESEGGKVPITIHPVQ